MELFSESQKTKIKWVLGIAIFLTLSAKVVALIFLILSTSALPSGKKAEIMILGNWNEPELESLMKEATGIDGPGERIDFISEKFLGTPYEAHTLTGDAHTPEIFTVNLREMDCFTYIDYVEAIRVSESFSEFKQKLKDIRYQFGNVSFEKRNHFFTDWRVFNGERVIDVTEQVGGDKTKSVHKNLNKKKNGTYFVPGITPIERTVTYIPSDAINNQMLEKMKTGDYVGIYSHVDGLDVSHTGIIIKRGDKTYIRHASSRQETRKVLDEDLKTYVSDKPGLVILRPR